MKKLIPLVVLMMVVSVVASFAAGEKEAAKAEEKHKLVWMLWDDPVKNGQQEIADLFMKDNPNIEVEIQRVPHNKYEEKIRTMLSGGDAPGVIQINDDYVKEYAFLNLTYAMDAQIKESGLKKEDMFKTNWDFAIVDGHFMAIIPAAKVRCIIYNKDATNEAGIGELPVKWETPEWNWDTFLEYAKKLTKVEGPRTVQWGANLAAPAYDRWMDNAIAGRNDLYNADATEFVAATPAGNEAGQYLQDMVTVHKVAPPWGTAQKSANIDNLFYSGQLAMNLSGNWVFQSIRDKVKFDWDAASIPMKVEGHTTANLVCYGIAKVAPEPEISFKLISYLLTEEAAQIFAKRSLVPTVRSVAEEYYRDGSKQHDMILEGLNYAYPPVFSIHTAKAKYLTKIAISKIFSGEQRAAEIHAEIKAQIEPILRGEKK